MSKTLGGTRLTRRGLIASRVLIAACFALSAVAGFTADTWNPFSAATVVQHP